MRFPRIEIIPGMGGRTDPEAQEYATAVSDTINEIIEMMTGCCCFAYELPSRMDHIQVQIRVVNKFPEAMERFGDMLSYGGSSAEFCRKVTFWTRDTAENVIAELFPEQDKANKELMLRHKAGEPLY